MRARPDPRDRLAPLRRPPSARSGETVAAPGLSPVAAADPALWPDRPAAVPVPVPVPEIGGWVPPVDRAAVDDDLLSEWAPRPDPGRHRTDEPDPPELSVDRWDETDDGHSSDNGQPSDDDEPAAGAGRPDTVDSEPRNDDNAGSEPGRARAHRINGQWGRFAELWVPESLREARVDPGRRGMIVLVLVAAIAAVVAAVGVWRDRPEPRPVETSVVAGVSAAVTPAAPVVSASPVTAAGPANAAASVPATPAASEILVSVTGLVANPGVVRLPPESRVADAIAAAGGTQPGANLTGMNLAAKLADGDSVVVADTPTAAGAASPPGVGSGGSSGGPTAAAGGLVNLNTADEAALDTLPGVGPVMAQNILAWRETNGTFTSVEQLQEISGIGPSRYAQLAPLVTVG